MTVPPVGAPGAGVPVATPSTARAAVPYDFRRPAALAREHSRVLGLAFETFARQWGTQLTAKVRVPSQVSFEGVALRTYDDHVSSLPATTAMVLCDVGGTAAKAVIQFPAAAALNWVSHMLGSTSASDVAERRFTRIEQTLVEGLMGEALEDLRYSLGALLEAPLAVDEIHYNSQFAQAAAKSELMVAASFAVRVGDRSVPATLALPADAVLPRLGDATPPAATADAPALIRAQLAETPVDVALRLAPAKVTPRAVMDLAVGDVLALPHGTHRPFHLSVAGRTLGQAAAGARGGRIAAVVVSTEENPA
ncbi:flagellar motor switch protein FliM [Arthrobacter halodurans]|uniref:Flagellar motor switch protein FliM n=1 Tax=Arthrobacter halodurans TaxID=516699 RepID=A0ABV4UR34_9MICC